MGRKENNTRWKRVPKRTLLSILISTAVIYALNAGLIFFNQPINEQMGEESANRGSDSGFAAIGMRDLSSGGIGPFHGSASGYVDFFSSRQEIYVNYRSIYKGSYDVNVEAHESAHVLQKNRIAEIAGGFPSYWNPIQTARYTTELLKLNDQLREVMPKVENVETPFDGLESAAECYAEKFLTADDRARFFQPYYFSAPARDKNDDPVRKCTDEQWRIAETMEF